MKDTRPSWTLPRMVPRGASFVFGGGMSAQIVFGVSSCETIVEYKGPPVPRTAVSRNGTIGLDAWILIFANRSLRSLRHLCSRSEVRSPVDTREFWKAYLEMQLPGRQDDVLPSLLDQRLHARVSLVQQPQSFDELGHVGRLTGL